MATKKGSRTCQSFTAARRRPTELGKDPWYDAAVDVHPAAGGGVLGRRSCWV